MCYVSSFAMTSEDAAGLTAVKALQIASGGKVTFAEFITAPNFSPSQQQTFEKLPPRAVIRIELHPAPRSNIRVELWLPEVKTWNARFIGTGNGGAAGGIPYGSLAWMLQKGYAVATTDMGTAPNADSGVGNPEVWKDFGYRATHCMTIVAKQVIQAYYGKLPVFSYFTGSSTGGQQALQEAQRYPDDYDGILAGVPAHCRTPLHAYFLWNEQIFQRCPFTPEQEQSVINAALAYLAPRELPQTAGKIVSDPRCPPEDIEAVISLARKNDPTLTDQHAQALRQLFDGPRHAETGERIFNGIPLGSRFDSAKGHLYLFKWVFGADKNPLTLNFGKDIDAYTQALGPYLNAENPDLSAFEARGGKLLMFSGSADSCVPYHATLDYYERVVDRFGSLARVQTFFRYYIIPGMGHSLGSGAGITRQPDLLTLLENWRENGIAPGRLPVSRVVNNVTEYTMTIAPYPQQPAQTDAAAPTDGARGGVQRVSDRFRPAPQE